MAARIKLYESRGETSVFIDAEIRDDGELVLSGQDVGAASEKYFGDSDYEYWVHVPAAELPALLGALRRELAARARGRSTARDDSLAARVGRFLKRRRSHGPAHDLSRDRTEAEVLRLLKDLFAGDPRAVSAFLDFTAAHGIRREFGSWS